VSTVAAGAVGTVVSAGAVEVAGVAADTGACAAVPRSGELGYDVPPVVDAWARAGKTTRRVARTNATTVRRDISCTGLRRRPFSFLS
jgi:hypothetical protein